MEMSPHDINGDTIAAGLAILAGSAGTASLREEVLRRKRLRELQQQIGLQTGPSNIFTDPNAHTTSNPTWHPDDMFQVKVSSLAEKIADFNPDYTPKQLEDMGVYRRLYGGNPNARLASMTEWPKEWLGPDKQGWLAWYKEYSDGRRLPEEDDRQIKRWKSFVARHGTQLALNPTPRRGHALVNWAVDPTKLVDRGQAPNLTKAMKEYQLKHDEKFDIQKQAGDSAYVFSEREDVEPGEQTLHRFDVHQNNKNVGYLTTHPATEGGMWLKGMKVDPLHRGKGLARSLVEQALQKYPDQEFRLRARPYDDKALDVEKLKAFYARLGFKPYDDENRMVLTRNSKQAAEHDPNWKPPGIPDRSNYGDHTQLPVNQLATYVRQLHQAQRAGTHWDHRIGTPEHGLFSWATKKEMPKPGERPRAWFQQPLHNYDYKDFDGPIVKGYGTGGVKKEHEGDVLLTKVEPDQIHFTTAHGGDPERFALIKSKDAKRWLIVNTTPTQPLGQEKTKYTSVPAEQAEDILKNLQPGASAQAKIDGASTLGRIHNDRVDLLSHRVSKKHGRPIYHTERVLGGRPEVEMPKEHEGTVLKGETYGVNPEGKAIPPQELGGLLNSSISKSLRDQQSRGVNLKSMFYDISQEGKNKVTTDTPYAERLQKVKDVLQKLNMGDKFHTPEEAKTPEEAVKLWNDIKTGKNPITQEGVVIHPPTGRPIKSKLMDEHNVHIKGVFPGEGKYENQGAGGFTYSHTSDGPIVGKVGTGLDDETRKLLWDDPGAYMGRLARVASQQKFPSGALRVPSFLAFNEDSPSRRDENRETVNALLKAKAHSDVRQYSAKHQILADLMSRKPHEFSVDSTTGPFVGITHTPSKFRIHAPLTAVPKQLWSDYQSKSQGATNVQSIGS